MDRNIRHSSYSSSLGPRSLPHAISNGGKRHSQDGRYDVRHGDGRHSDVRHSGDVRHDVRHSGDVRQDVRHEGRHVDMRDVRHEGRHADVRERSGDVRQGEGRHGARLSPPFPAENNNNNNNQHDDLIHYIYESWNKVTREVERGSEDTKYYQEVVAPRQLANFRPFNLEEWWGRRLMQNIKRQQQRS